MGKKLNAILILMVLFTFASLLSEPPTIDNVQTETEHVSLSQATDTTNTGSVSTESNKSYAAPPEPNKDDAVAEQNKEAESKQETRSINDPDEVDESDDSTSTSESIESSAADPATTPTYQDDEWRKAVLKWNPILVDDMQALSTYATNMDFEGMGSRSKSFRLSSNLALKESKQYTVSPELEVSKSEYEGALEDYISASDEIQNAIEDVNNNDIDAAIGHIKTSGVYMNTGGEHMTSAAEAAQ